MYSPAVNPRRRVSSTASILSSPLPACRCWISSPAPFAVGKMAFTSVFVGVGGALVARGPFVRRPLPWVTGCHPPQGFWPPARQTTLGCADGSRKPGNRGYPGRPGQAQRPCPFLHAVVDVVLRAGKASGAGILCVSVVKHGHLQPAGHESAPLSLPGPGERQTPYQRAKVFAARHKGRVASQLELALQ